MKHDPDNDPFLGPMTHQTRVNRGETSESWEARLLRLGRDLEDELTLPDDSVHLTFEPSVVRIPGLEGKELYGGMIRIRAWRHDTLLKNNLMPLETEHGLYLSQKKEDVDRLLERQVKRMKENS